MGQVCSYQVSLPHVAGSYDKLKIKVQELEDARIFVSVADSIFSEQTREYELVMWDYLEIRHPMSAYI